MRVAYFVYAICLGSVSGVHAIASHPGVGQNQARSGISRFYERIGVFHFSYWDGPGLDGFSSYTPNAHGKPAEAGWSLTSLLSVRYPFWRDIGVDIQNQIQWIQTRRPELRLQAPRIGVGGTLLSGRSWRLSGAINTDIPGVGYTMSRRKTLFDPGLFASLRYRPEKSRWSLFALVKPRLYFYSDRQAVEPEWLAAKLRPGQKPEAVFSVTPTLNYAFGERVGARLGITLDYRKTVEADWWTWTRWKTPVLVGPTFKIGEALSIFAYVNTYPWDGKGLSLETSSIGMWLSGVLL